MTIGILGAGQLGRMLALAGYPLGLHFQFFDSSAESPAASLAPLTVSPFEDSDRLDQFAQTLSVATYEFENIPTAAVRHLAKRIPVYPPVAALETAQDRLYEKRLFERLQIPTTRFRAVSSLEDLTTALEDLGVPAVLKTRRCGYDGKGQVILKQLDQAEAAWRALGSQDLLCEEFIAFEREFSLIAVRGTRGDTAFYPLVENHHRDGILRLSLAPSAHVTPELDAQAQAYALRLMTEFDYVGVLTVEFFACDGVLVAGEIAPRVHNSGHWTIEGAETSQFENHLRACLGMPLGATQPIGHSAMVNLIGTIPDTAAILAIPGAHLHLYGKSPKAGRKLGHITLRHRDAGHLHEALSTLGVLMRG